MPGQGPNIWIAWRENPHSARYRLHHGISGAFLQVIPWLNAILVIALFLIVSKRITIAPGIFFQLPRAPFAEGVGGNAPCAALLAPAPGEPALLFFDGIRYRIGDDGECDRLAGAMRRSLEKDGWAQVVLYAAADVPHGDVVRFVNAARRAGVAGVNVAVKPEGD